MEAHGLRLGLQLLQHFPGNSLPVHIQGDCLPIIRFGAGTGQLRQASTQGIIEASLAALAMRPSETSWQLVPRRLNHTAHMLAQEGLRTWSRMGPVPKARMGLSPDSG